MNQMSQREQNRMEKERRIIEGALSVFAEAGYSGASMDAIARRADVSKPTLYQYFGSKEQLFEAIMVHGRDYMIEPFERPSPRGMVHALYTFAWHYADIVLRPEFLSLARLVIGEAQRFPEIGRFYQTSGPDRVLAGMMNYLEQQRAVGRLAFDDAELAAQDLWALILAAPRNQALHIPDAIPDRAAVKRYIDNGLRVFLKAYSTDPKSDQAALAAVAAEAEKA
jgi:AcrR family transcriptional regulator